MNKILEDLTWLEENPCDMLSEESTERFTRIRAFVEFVTKAMQACGRHMLCVEHAMDQLEAGYPDTSGNYKKMELYEQEWKSNTLEALKILDDDTYLAFERKRHDD